MLLNQLEHICEHLINSFIQEEFKGYDPFDALNSRFFARCSFLNNSRLCKLAWLQFHKRLPINIRSLVGIAPCQNPKAIALIIMGLIYSFRRKRAASDLELAIKLANELLQNKSFADSDGVGWGYPFPWQARAFFVDKNIPNIIVTSYVANAFALLVQEKPHNIYEQALIEMGRFIMNQLYNEEKGYFYYIPLNRDIFVHNANLWGAVTVTRAALLSGNKDWLIKAKNACLLTVKAQQKNGSWMYGELPHHQFIDGFHTGYNLEALKVYQDLMAESLFKEAIKKGYRFYLENLFDSNGAAKYYHNATYPLDAHSVSQAMLTITQLGGIEDDALLRKIVQFSLENLYDSRKGYFYYQKHAFYTNKIVYLRWTQAWMYYSLSYLLNEKPELFR